MGARTGKIVSMPTTREFRDNFDRIFRAPRPPVATAPAPGQPSGEPGVLGPSELEVLDQQIRAAQQRLYADVSRHWWLEAGGE